MDDKLVTTLWLITLLGLTVILLSFIIIPYAVFGYYHQDRHVLVTPLWLFGENELHVFNIFILIPPQHDLVEDVNNHEFYPLKHHLHVIPLYLVEKFPEHSINNEQFGCINGEVYGCLTDENILIINGHQGDIVDGNLTLSAHLIKRVYEKDMIW